MLALALSINAQFVEIEGVKGSRFRGVNPILTGEDQTVSGYYTYYMVEKGEKGERTFEFALIDKELSGVKKTQITMNKRAVIKNTVFNGSFMLIHYDDIKNKQIKLNIIDTEGKIVVDKGIPTEKRWLTDADIYADATGDGFYIVAPVLGKKVKGYSIEKVNNKLDQVWKIEQVPVKGQKSIADLVNNKDRFVIWEENNPKLSGDFVKPAIVAFDAKTGQKIFSREAYDGSSTILYNQLRISDDGSVFAGGAYVDGEKIKDVNNAGIYLLKLNVDGKEVLYNKVSNEEKIQEALKAISTGFSVGSKDKVFIEDLIIDNDAIYVISEMFSKNLNATPWRIQWTRDLITGKYIGSPKPDDKKTSKVVFQIQDFILFKFNPEGELVEIKPIPKEKKMKITVWDPYLGYAGLPLAREIRSQGWFDYAFVEKDENGQIVMVCKDNAEAEKSGKTLEASLIDKGPSVFTYTLDGNYAQKTINLKQQSKVDLEKGKVGYFNALRNSAGKIAVVYYQRKLQKISIALEATN